MAATVPAGARLAIATGNAHKAEEIRAILAATIPDLLPEHVVTTRDVGGTEPVEDGVTFQANALIKARALAAHTGLPSIADDSGICVDVLGGAPGIFSARWSGTHGDDAANLDLLLAQIADVPAQHRSGSFTCAAALVLPDGTETVAIGVMDGVLTYARQGHGGFGYDPIFIAHGQSVTNAELTAEQKNAISHRGQAFEALAADVAAALRT